MEFLETNNTISKITLAITMKATEGKPVHTNRPTHGLAFNVNCTSVYTFASGEVLECGTGDCIFLPKGSDYTVKKTYMSSTEPAFIHAVNFEVANDETFSPQIFHTRGKSEFESMFSKASIAWKNKYVGYYEECFSSLYKIIRLLKKEKSTYSQQSKILATLAPAIKYINENYTTENIRLPLLAKLCNISEPYLRKLFNNAFSVSPSVYVRNLRINYAKGLIDSGEYTIAEVAVISGFADITYFSREFKKATGVSPKIYAGKQK